MQHSDAKSQQKTHALTQHWTHYWHAITNYQVSRFAITLTLQCSYCKTNIQTNYHYYLPMLWDYLEIKRLYFLIGPTPVSFQTFSHKNIIANFSRIKNSDRQSRRLTCQPLDLPPNRPYTSEPQPSFCIYFHYITSNKEGSVEGDLDRTNLFWRMETFFGIPILIGPGSWRVPRR